MACELEERAFYQWLRDDCGSAMFEVQDPHYSLAASGYRQPSKHPTKAPGEHGVTMTKVFAPLLGFHC